MDNIQDQLRWITGSTGQINEKTNYSQCNQWIFSKYRLDLNRVYGASKSLSLNKC